MTDPVAGLPSDRRTPPASSLSSRMDENAAPTRRHWSVPGLVLLAAVAVFEGYQWLRLIPGESLRPSGFLFAVLVLPATYGLTRRWSSTRRLLRWTILLCSACIPILGVVAFFASAAAWTQLLGIASLALAAAAIALAAASEHVNHPYSQQR